jgi:hypothetical protein
MSPSVRHPERPPNILHMPIYRQWENCDAKSETAGFTFPQNPPSILPRESTVMEESGGSAAQQATPKFRFSETESEFACSARSRVVTFCERSVRNAHTP